MSHGDSEFLRAGARGLGQDKEESLNDEFNTDPLTQGFIAAAYQLANEYSPRQMRRELLNRLCDIVRADAVVWYLTDVSRARVCSAVGVHIPESVYYQRQGRAEDVTGYRQAFTQPNHVLDPSDLYPDEVFFASRFYSSMMAPFGIHRLLRYAAVHPALVCDSMIAIYRKDRERFSARQRAKFELLAFHLVEAFVLCLRRCLKETAGADRQALICGPQGLPIMCSEGFSFEDRLPMNPPDVDLARLLSKQSEGGRQDFEIHHLDDLYVILPTETDLLGTLSDREREVAEQLAQGRTLKEVAEQMKLSAGTISSFANRIYEKLDINGKGELIRLMASSNKPGR